MRKPDVINKIFYELCRAATADMFSAHACVQRLLEFEAALARSAARVGAIPDAAAGTIAGCCDAGSINLQQLASAASQAGNPAVPLVKQLTALVARIDPDAAKYVHWGASAQDALDSAMVLQLRDALDLLDGELELLADAVAEMVCRYRDAPLAGCGWDQHAPPVTFGLKAAGWLDALLRHRQRLSALRARTLVLQFGGSAGTLASLGAQAMPLAQALSDELRLTLPDTPWHTQRDRIAEAASMLGLLTASLGEMARDISLLMQNEVVYVAEPGTKGRAGASARQHKRHAVACATVLAAATRVPGLVATMLSAMVQEHEGALGGWQLEWWTLPEIVLLNAEALQQMRVVAAGLTLDERRTRADLEATRGLILAEAVTTALGAALGPQAAHDLVEAACRRANWSGRHLRDALLEDTAVAAHLPPEQIDSLLAPANYLGQAGTFADRVLQAHRQYRQQENQDAVSADR
jgi:3-carboxy-cis,cis-muconate cycloisomerase